MTHWLRFVVLLSVLAPFTVVRAAQEAPNQPESCANEHGTDPAHTCTCHQSCDPLDTEKQAGEDPKCKVYCRADHCHCKAMCPDTES
jgi:hypothetical protein